MIDVLHLDGLLDQMACTALRRELRLTGGAGASLLGDAVPRPLVRRATLLTVETALAQRMVKLFMTVKERLERHFAVTLDTCEPPQFLRYQTGDFFVAHQDGNTPLIRDDSRFRKISVVLFLSAPSAAPRAETYGGGDLILHGPFQGPMLRVPVNGAPGSLVAFRAETTHEVTPVAHGERFTVVTWFR